MSELTKNTMLNINKRKNSSRSSYDLRRSEMAATARRSPILIGVVTVLVLLLLKTGTKDKVVADWRLRSRSSNNNT